MCGETDNLFFDGRAYGSSSVLSQVAGFGRVIRGLLLGSSDKPLDTRSECSFLMVVVAVIGFWIAALVWQKRGCPVSGKRKVVLGEVTEEDLGGFPLKELKCRACSGYGNCGYRMYRLHEGKPVAICQMRKKELLGEKAE